MVDSTLSSPIFLKQWKWPHPTLTKSFPTLFIAIFSFVFSAVAQTVTVCGYKVTTTVTYNSPLPGQTTFTWVVQNTNPGNGSGGTFQDLSHWSMKFGPCVDESKHVSGGEIVDTDPSQDCLGGPLLKFDEGTTGSTPKTYTAVFQGTNYVACLVDAVFKSGQATPCCTDKVYGICCCDFTVSCPTKTDLGKFNCKNLKYVPAKPTTIDALKKLGFIISGTPCGTVKIVVQDSGTVNTCSETDQVITRTITVWDDLNNNNEFDSNETGVTCKLTFTIEADTTPPTIECPADTTVECRSDVPKPDITKVKAWDDCKVTVRWVKDSVVGTCPKIIYRIYKAYDPCGHTVYCKQKITVNDTTPPKIYCPKDTTVECISDVPKPDITKVKAWDNCGTTTVRWVKDSTYGKCPKYIKRVYKATDGCNTVYCYQIITVNDTTPPTIYCPKDTTVQCRDAVPKPDITKVKAWDNCGKVWVYWVKDSVPNTCPKVITRTYKVTDGCNTVYCKQKITVIDTVPPTIECPKDTTIACGGTVPAVDLTKVKAWDNCGIVRVRWVKDSTVGTCPKYIYRIFKAFDLCVNTVYCKQKITVPCCKEFCTYTQGFYGNKNGLALLPSLLTTPLVVGRPGQSFIIPANNSTTNSAALLNSILPGGSTPDELNPGDCDITTACLDQYLTDQGKINNVLLSQTITLTLNTRVNSSLLSLPIQSGYLVTDGGTCVQLNTAVVNYLTANGTKTATVSDLLNLANDVLGGVKTAGVGGVPSLSNINDAVDQINNAFDECQKFSGYYPSCPGSTISTNSIVTSGQQGEMENVSALKVSAYPNPFNDKIRFVIQSPVSGRGSLDVFNLLGQKVGTVYQGHIFAGRGQIIDYNVPALLRTNLVYRLSVGNHQVAGKLINLK